MDFIIFLQNEIMLVGSDSNALHQH